MAKKRFGDILLEARMVTPEELERGLSAKAVDSDKRLGAILVGLGILTERQVTEALGLQFMLPVVDVQDYVTNASTQNILPLDLLERLNAFCVGSQMGFAACHSYDGRFRYGACPVDG